MTRIEALRTFGSHLRFSGSVKMRRWAGVVGTGVIIGLGGLALINGATATAPQPYVIWVNDAGFLPDKDITDGICDINAKAANGTRTLVNYSALPTASTDPNVVHPGAQPRCNITAALQQLNSAKGYDGYAADIVIKVDPDWIASLNDFKMGASQADCTRIMGLFPGTVTAPATANCTFHYQPGFLTDASFWDVPSNTVVSPSTLIPAGGISGGNTPYLIRDVTLADGSTIKNVTKYGLGTATTNYDTVTPGMGTGDPGGNLNRYAMTTVSPYYSMPGRKSALNPNCANVGSGVANGVNGAGFNEDVQALFVVAPRLPANAPATLTTPAACNTGWKPSGSNYYSDFSQAGAARYDTWNFHSVIIDLGYQLSWNIGRLDGWATTVFFINGANVTMRGLHNIYSGETSFYAGPRSENFTLTDGFARTPGYGPERYLVVRGGAKNTTLKNHTISGFADQSSYHISGEWVNLAMTGPNWPVDGFTVDRVRFLAPGGSGTSVQCNNNTSATCGSNGIQISNDTGQFVSGLRFTRNYMEYLNRVANNRSQMIDANNARFQWNVTGLNATTWGNAVANSTKSECVWWQPDAKGNPFPPDISDYYDAATGTIKGSFPYATCTDNSTPATAQDGTILVQDNLVQSPLVRNAGEALLGFDNASLNNLIVKNNTVLNSGNDTNNTTAATAAEFLSLPSDIAGSVEVRGNYLSHSGGPGTNAIYWDGKMTCTTSTPCASGAQGNLTSSKAVITQNYFDWRITTTTNSVVKLLETGLVDTSLNLYAAGSVSQTTTGAEEVNITGGGMLTQGSTAAATAGATSYTIASNNNALTANAKMNTWWTSSATPAVGCVVPLTIAPPSDSEYKFDISTAGVRYPTGAHYVDVYWTAQNDAEVFIGRFPVSLDGPQSDGSAGTSARTTLSVPLPLPAPQGATAAIRASLANGTYIDTDETSPTFNQAVVPGYESPSGSIDNTGGAVWATLTADQQNEVLNSLAPSSRMLSGYPLVPTWKGIGAPKYDVTDSHQYGKGYPSAADDPTRQVIIPAAGPVDPVSGNITGYLRLQTVDPTANPAMPAVSQFSRAVAISGKCAPALTLNQASNQADASSARFLHFTLTSTMPLDPTSIENYASLVVNDGVNTIEPGVLNRSVSALTQATFDSTPTTSNTFGLTAANTPYCSINPAVNNTQALCTAPEVGGTWVTFTTVPGSSLNPKIVSIQAIDGVVGGNPVSAANNQVFDIVVSLDDSGVATLTLGAEKVTAAPSNGGTSTCITLPGTVGDCMVNASTNLANAAFGLPNPQAATFNDNQVTFANPLRVTPALSSTIINQLIPGTAQDEANILVKSYNITLAGKVAEPTAPVTFTATPSVQPGAPVVANGVALQTYLSGAATGNYDVTLTMGTGAAVSGTMVIAGPSTLEQTQAWPSGPGGYVMTMADAANVPGSTATTSQPMWLRASCPVGWDPRPADPAQPYGDALCQVMGAGVTISHGQATSDDMLYYNLWVPSASVKLFSSSAAPRLDIADYVLDSHISGWEPGLTSTPAGAIYGDVWVNTSHDVWVKANAATPVTRMDGETDMPWHAGDWAPGNVFDTKCVTGLETGCGGAKSNPDASAQATIDQVTNGVNGWRKVCDTYGGWNLVDDHKLNNDCVAKAAAMENGKPVCFVYTAINTPPNSVASPTDRTEGAWPSLLENVDFFTNDGTLNTSMPGASKVSEVTVPRIPGTVTLEISRKQVDVSSMAEGYVATVPALPRDGFVQVMTCGISHPDGAEPEEVQE